MFFTFSRAHQTLNLWGMELLHWLSLFLSFFFVARFNFFFCWAWDFSILQKQLRQGKETGRFPQNRPLAKTLAPASYCKWGREMDRPSFEFCGTNMPWTHSLFDLICLFFYCLVYLKWPGAQNIWIQKVRKVKLQLFTPVGFDKTTGGWTACGPLSSSLAAFHDFWHG